MNVVVEVDGAAAATAAADVASSMHRLRTPRKSVSDAMDHGRAHAVRRSAVSGTAYSWLCCSQAPIAMCSAMLSTRRCSETAAPITIFTSANLRAVETTQGETRKR